MRLLKRRVVDIVRDNFKTSATWATHGAQMRRKRIEP